MIAPVRSPPPADTDAGLPLAAALRAPCIGVRGARTHNLKNIDLDIPKHRLTVITGLSGSGKSSLAFDTLYAEGQRRYVESLSTYARQFLSVMDKPDVDVIEGLSPAISIEQKAASHNPRSTVGTVTEIHDYLRLLFARAGTPYCPQHDLPLAAQTVSQMVDAVLALPGSSDPGSEMRLMILAPVARGKKGEFGELLAQLQAQGYVRFRIDGQVVQADALPVINKAEKHDLDVVVDRLKVRAESDDADGGNAAARLADSIEAALRLAEGRVIALEMDSGAEHLFNARFACPVCGYSIAELEPRLFSFNSPQGACPACEGLGMQAFFDPERVVAFPSLSLAGGAIKGWDRRNAHAFAFIESLAAHYKFDAETPFEQLSAPVQQVLLYGSGKEVIRFNYTMQSGNFAGKPIVKKHAFEGVIPNFERRWRETDSAVVREELARLRAHRACPECGGARLSRTARHVFIGEGAQRRAIYQVSHVTLGEAKAYFDALRLTGAKAEIAAKVVREIGARLAFLSDVGLPYLSLDRSAETLSGGEAQRIRLASQIGSGLSGVMYVLDEPSIGLHQRDNARLIATLQHLRDLGNTVIVVEHDQDTMRAADHIIDLGPGAGVHGGRVMAQGSYAQVAAMPGSVTGQYLSGVLRIAVPKRRRASAAPPACGAQEAPGWLRVQGACGNNLKNVTVDFPLGLLTCVTGVSGSGKSTLVNDTLYASAAQTIMRTQTESAPCERIEGLRQLDKVIAVDQSPIGRTPRSNPATYIGLFTPIRELMASTSAARERGWGPGRFSFNVAQGAGGGRCEACQGDGVVKVEMHFLPDVYVPCDVCQGRRYNRETLQVQWKGRNIAQILDMTAHEALEFFADQPPIARKLQTLRDVGLGYLTLGQSATTLSGGEAQRVKLALELSRRDTGKTLYILDEPTTGLHFADIDLLLKVLQQLRDAGNTIIVIEHNLDVIKTADWVIDLGPEGGAGGGGIVAQGTPETVAAAEGSHTGRYLRQVLESR